MDVITGIIIAAVPSVLSGIVIKMVNDSRIKQDQREAERDEREMLTLQSLDAIFAITKELTECVLNHKKPNGELQEAYEYKQDTKHKLEAYERKKAARS